MVGHPSNLSKSEATVDMLTMSALGGVWGSSSLYDIVRHHEQQYRRGDHSYEALQLHMVVLCTSLQ